MRQANLGRLPKAGKALTKHRGDKPRVPRLCGIAEDSNSASARDDNENLIEFSS
jgi:hypothetical protein